MFDFLYTTGVLLLYSLAFQVILVNGGFMTPKNDMFLILGSDLEINCTMSSNQSNSTEDADNQSDVRLLSIIKNRNTTQPPGWELTYFPEQNTLQLYKQNVTFKDSGTYKCYYNNIYADIKKVNVGEMPGKPDILYCVSNNWEDMSCYVDLAGPTHVPTNWTMLFRTEHQKRNLQGEYIKDYDSVCRETPDVTQLKCHLPVAEFRMFESYLISVKGYVDYYNYTVHSDVFHIETNESIVKPPVVTSLETTLTNISSRVELSWGCPQLFDCDVILEFKVTVICQEDWDIPVRVLDLTTDMNYTVDDLIPHAAYTFQVEAKPIEANGDMYWSDKVSANKSTLSDVPGRSTRLSTGSFLLLECNTTELFLVLYWKNPAPRYRHGEIVSYTVELDPEPDNGDTDNSKAVAVTDLSSMTTDIVYSEHSPISPVQYTETVAGVRIYARLKTKLSKTVAYTGKMWVSTVNGSSQVFSQFHVPVWSQGVKARVSWVSVEIGQDDVRVAWDVTSTTCTDVTHITYYWCTVTMDTTGNSSYTMCQDGLDWYTVSVENGCENATFQWLNKTGDQSTVKYAVSIATGNISGGMMWETLRFNNYQAVPDEPLYRVHIDQSQLTVTMLYSGQHVREGGRPDLYEVMYKIIKGSTKTKQCPSDGNMMTVPVDFSNTTLEVPLRTSEVKPGTRYIVCVRASNQFGVGPYGEPQIVEIVARKNDNSSVWKIAVGTIGGLVAIGLLIGGIRCTCNKMKQKEKSFEVKSILPDPTLIKTQNHPDDDLQTITIEGHPEGDSGRGSSEDHHMSDQDAETTSDVSSKDSRLLDSGMSCHVGGNYISSDDIEMSGMSRDMEHDALVPNKQTSDSGNGEENKGFDSEKEALVGNNQFSRSEDGEENTGTSHIASESFLAKTRKTHKYEEIFDQVEDTDELKLGTNMHAKTNHEKDANSEVTKNEHHFPKVEKLNERIDRSECNVSNSNISSNIQKHNGKPLTGDKTDEHKVTPTSMGETIAGNSLASTDVSEQSGDNDVVNEKSDFINQAFVMDNQSDLDKKAAKTVSGCLNAFSELPLDVNLTGANILSDSSNQGISLSNEAKDLPISENPNNARMNFDHFNGEFVDVIEDSEIGEFCGYHAADTLSLGGCSKASDAISLDSIEIVPGYKSCTVYHSESGSDHEEQTEETANTHDDKADRDSYKDGLAESSDNVTDCEKSVDDILNIDIQRNPDQDIQIENKMKGNNSSTLVNSVNDKNDEAKDKEVSKEVNNSGASSGFSEGELASYVKASSQKTDDLVVKVSQNEKVKVKGKVAMRKECTLSNEKVLNKPPDFVIV